MRLLGAIACECDLELCHFDVDQAFVQSDLEEDVFLRLPNDVVIFQERSFGSTKACMD